MDLTKSLTRGLNNTVNLSFDTRLTTLEKIKVEIYSSVWIFVKDPMAVLQLYDRLHTGTIELLLD